MRSFWLGSIVASLLSIASCSDEPAAAEPGDPDGSAGDGASTDGDADGTSDGVADGTPDGTPDTDGGPLFRALDVAILFPRETTPDGLLPLTYDVDGAPHTLLAESEFDRLRSGEDNWPIFSPVAEPGLYGRMRVTALRADPCADSFDPSHEPQCTRQVRLVVQQAELLEGEADPLAFSDSSLHLFFEPDDARFVALLSALHTLGETVPDNPALTVHPTLAREGLRGEHAEALRRAITAACRAEDLHKITFLNGGPHGDDWTFHVFARTSDGALSPREIPGMTDDGGDHMAASFAMGGDPALFGGFMDDQPAFPMAMLDPEAVRTMSKATLAAGIAQLDSLLNPVRSHPGTVACNACHVAEKTLHSVRSERSDLTLPPSSFAFQPPAGQNVQGSRVTDISLRNLHAFSYFRTEPTILARVIHESAVSAAFLGSSAFRASLSPTAQAMWDEAFPGGP